MDEFSSYLASIDNPDHRERVTEVLTWVQETFPQLQPKVAWNQPMFTDHDTYIIGFSVAKQHMAVAPEAAGIQHFTEVIKEAGHSHTNQLVRFRWDKPFDFELLKQMIAFNIEDKADCTTFWRK
ncbi:iron chaperone [Paenibacillus daejeonensis]|uniref:iron chaperone n=1 Tax=Paenibacillus daejeonensis TaxID=135193 RepID=UPI000373BC81|nr:iron chaperone [Paenibacillus daejeonensis]